VEFVKELAHRSHVKRARQMSARPRRYFILINVGVYITL